MNLVSRLVISSGALLVLSIFVWSSHANSTEFDIFNLDLAQLTELEITSTELRRAYR